MEYCKGRVTKLLVEYFENDYRRIEHALNVLKEAEILLADYKKFDYEIVVASALLHDVGIKISEEKLGYNTGKTQEEFGPEVAETLLKSMDFPPNKILKVKEIIGNHHSPSRYPYEELEILKKADKIINLAEL